MEWTQSDTIALADQSCKRCKGLGLRMRRKAPGKKKYRWVVLEKVKRNAPGEPCECALREIFRICFNQFRHCSSKERFMSRVTLRVGGGKENRCRYERLDEDYVADFTLIAKRTLDEFDWGIFAAHFLHGLMGPNCARLLKTDEGTFWHRVYKIEQKLGRVFRELEPYSLFPIGEYFGGVISRKRLSVELPSGAAVDATARPGSAATAGVVASTNRRLAFPRPPIRGLTPATSSSNKRAA